MLLFEAGGKFYFWNRIDDTVSEITTPTDLDKILDIMRTKGAKGLKLKTRI